MQRLPTHPTTMIPADFNPEYGHRYNNGTLQELLLPENDAKEDAAGDPPIKYRGSQCDRNQLVAMSQGKVTIES